MKVPYRCACGRQTTEPYEIGGVRMCVICAEGVAPRVVDSRERYARSLYREPNKPWIKRSKHSPHW